MREGVGSTSAAIKTSSRKVSYLVVSVRTVSHSGIQQKCCTFMCRRASCENKNCSAWSIYPPTSLTDTANSRASRLELREQCDKTEGQYSTTSEIQVEE